MSIPSGGRTYDLAHPSEGDMTQGVSKGERTGQRGGDTGADGYTVGAEPRKIILRDDVQEGFHYPERGPAYNEAQGERKDLGLLRKMLTKRSGDSGMTCLERVKQAIDAMAPKSAVARAVQGTALTGTSAIGRVKAALDLGQNPALQTAGQLSMQQPSPALPQVNELMTQLAMKQLQEELNKSTEVNDPVEAENESLRRQVENLRLKKELLEKQQEMGALAPQQQGAAPAPPPAEGGMPPDSAEAQQAPAPPFEQALSPGQTM